MKPKYWNKGKIYLSNKDKVLKNLIKNFPKENMILNSNYYHALLNSIIGQQISVSAANAVKNRFFKLDKNMTPKKLLKIDIRTLKKIGLSRQKIQYIKNISIFFIENKILFLLGPIFCKAINNKVSPKNIPTIPEIIIIVK